MLNYRENSGEATREDYLELVKKIYEYHDHFEDIQTNFMEGNESGKFDNLLNLGDKDFEDLILKIYNMRHGVMAMHETLTIMVNSCYDTFNIIQTVEKQQTIDTQQMLLKELSND